MKLVILSLVFLVLVTEHAQCADKATMEKILREIDEYIKSVKDNKNDVSKKEVKETFSSNSINDAIHELEKALDEETKKEEAEKKEAEKKKEDDESKKTVEKQDEEIEKLLSNFITKEKLTGDGNKKSLSDAELIDAEYKKFQLENDELAKKSIENTENDEQVMKKSTDEKCEDTMSQKSCKRMADEKFCAIYPKQLKKRCRRTCKFCCGDNEKICKKLKETSSQVRERTCKSEKFHEFLNIQCPKTCGFCGKMPTEAPCTRSTYGCCWDSSIAKDHVGTSTDGCPPCKDHQQSVFCERFAVHCNDKLSLPGKQVRAMCPKSCRLCGPRKICQDKPNLHDSCLALKHNDEYGVSPCLANYHLMKYNCPKTCNICQKSTIECGKTRFGCCDDGVTIARSFNKENCEECSDSPDPQFKCKFLSEHGVCFSRGDFMKDVCAGSCGFCTKSKK